MDEMVDGIASGTPKPGWSDLPDWLRGEVGSLVGGEVVRAETRPGGFTPSVAAVLELEDDRRAFVKAAAEEVAPDGVAMHREEVRVLAGLAGCPEAPGVLGWVDRDGWVALVLEAIDGDHPVLPWRDDVLERVLAGLRGMFEGLTPSPLDAPPITDRLGDAFRGWRRTVEEGPAPDVPWIAGHLDELVALEQRWVEAAAGETLLHADLRADQILLTDDGIVVVDWAHACLGAPWVDVALMAPSVALQGGPAPGEVLARSGLADDVTEEDVAAVVAALAGYFVWHAAQPPIPGLPTIRAFQRAQGDHAIRWLEVLL